MTDDKMHVDRKSGPYWRVQIKDFGRVANAEITMAPLVVLLGKNNTGKSYVASILWAILNLPDIFLSDLGPSAENLPNWYQNFIRMEAIDDPEITPVDNREMMEWLNSLINLKKDEVVQRLLSLRSARIGSLNISLTEGCSSVHLNRSRAYESDSSATISLKPNVAPNKLEVGLRIQPDYKGGRFLNQSIKYAIDAAMVGKFNDGDAIYLPAARTGLMLAFKALVSSTLETLGIERKRTSEALPLPTIRFLQRLADSEIDQDNELTNAADFIEESILNGKIIREYENADPSFSYETSNATILPLHAASSMVTELAPFLLFLKSGDFERGLVFEEPEAHLHLAAQRSMARVIARVVNSGVPVVITTHSDTFIQELNLLMQIESHENRDALMAQYGYETGELLCRKDVKAYEFIGNGGLTHAVEAEINDFGIVSQSLNETLMRIADEVISVQEGVGEEE